MQRPAYSGGHPSPEIGTVPASSFLLTGLICQTSRCPLTLRELPGLAPTSTAFGLPVAGFPSNCRRVPLLSNSIPSSSLPTSGGHQWQGLRVHFLCDNRSVTDAISKHFCSDGALGGLVRSLFLAAARHSFWVSVTRVPGRLNSIADALSRSQVQRFRTLSPLAFPVPTPCRSNCYKV